MKLTNFFDKHPEVQQNLWPDFNSSSKFEPIHAPKVGFEASYKLMNELIIEKFPDIDLDAIGADDEAGTAAIYYPQPRWDIFMVLLVAAYYQWMYKPGGRVGRVGEGVEGILMQILRPREPMIRMDGEPQISLNQIEFYALAMGWESEDLLSAVSEVREAKRSLQ